MAELGSVLQLEIDELLPVLDERPSHLAPARRFRGKLEGHMSEDFAEKTLKTVTSWARYAEAFAFDEARACSVWRIRPDGRRSTSPG